MMHHDFISRILGKYCYIKRNEEPNPDVFIILERFEISKKMAIILPPSST